MVRVCGALRRLLADNAAALERAQRSEREMRAILDTIPVGIMIAEAPSGRILGRNKMLDQIIGAPDAVGGEAAGSDDYTKYTANHADGRPVEPHEHPLAQITSGKTREAYLQAHYLRPDGTRIWTDLQGAAILDEEGNLKGAVLAMSDIDRRKRAEAAQLAIADELRHRTEEAEAAREAAEAANRAQERLSRQHEPRAAHAAVGRDRLHRAARGGERGSRDLGRPRQDQEQRQAPAQPDQRRARSVKGRGQQDGAVRRDGRARPLSRRRRVHGRAARQDQGQHSGARPRRRSRRDAHRCRETAAVPVQPARQRLQVHRARAHHAARARATRTG